MGKGSKNKKPKHRAKKWTVGRDPGASAPTPTDQPDFATRPTPERAQHHTVRLPEGAGKQERPAVIVDGDQIAALYEAKRITYGQEQAARGFQQLHFDYVAQIGINTGRSCLDIGPVGYDASDGNPELERRHRELTRALGMIRDAELRRVALNNRRPWDIAVLRSALDVVAGMV